MESLLNDDSLPIGLGGIGQRQWNDRLRFERIRASATGKDEKMPPLNF